MDTGARRAERAVPPDGEDRLNSALTSVQQIAEVRDRVSVTTRSDLASAAALGLGYLVVAVGWALTGQLPTLTQTVQLVVLIGLYVIAYRTEFVAPGGSTVPTQPILVGMVATCPLPLVPLAILLALQLGSLGPSGSGHHVRDFLARMISGWHCVGPVLVLTLLPVARPDLTAWRVYLLALLAQFVLDATSAAIRSAALGVHPRQLVAPLRWTFTIDALLAPLGLCVVIATAHEPVAIALLGVPIVLIRLLARDRSKQLEAAVALGTAFSAVKEEARVDVLTGLANRRAWVEALAEADARIRAGEDLTAVVLIADVDGLKRVNDTFGHDAGDELIRSVALVIAGAAPDAMVAARLGGDEFGLLVLAPPDAGMEEYLVPAVRTALERHPGIEGLPLSASLGLAASPPARGVTEAVSLADLAAAEDKVRRKAGRT